MGLWAVVACAGIALAGCGGGETSAPPEGGSAADSGAGGKRIKLAYVTNGVDPFWDVAAAGVRAAARDFDVDVQVLMPPKGLIDQKRMIETALATGIDGLAMSPIDAANQVGFINQACAVTNVITQDADAPESNRLCFVGMDNYKAGREAGKLVKEAIPEGGKVMIFVGRLEQSNSQQRRQGVIDELLDAPMQDANNLTMSPASEVIQGENYTILGTLTDNFDYAKAKSNAEDTIASHGDLACMVGLFAYNIPNCLKAVRDAGKLGQIKMVSFDEADDTLQGIVDGHVHGTVSQQPYNYGYDSVRILAGLARGDQSVLPEGGMLEVPVVVVRKENVEEFRTNLEALKAQGG
ncbi:MAG: substrate-binding domain-containing protein [Candidatus Hydrogenedentes bacterium]|nr:substrate-binding domain-containing protein [Candidatus Hydrogenedentota bacterium]